MMTNNCYYTRLLDRYCVYRVGGDPTERFAERLPYRKMSTMDRLILKVTVPLAHLVLPKIYKMESFLESFQNKIRMMVFQRKVYMMEYPEHRISYRIMHFVRIVRKVAKLEASIIGTLLLRPDSNSQLTF